MNTSRKILIQIIFWLHLPIVILLFSLFFVPTSIWPKRVIFHFWYMISITTIQFLWSTIIFKKFDIICPLTTIMQSLRGYKLKDKKNYGHSFIAEFLRKLKINVSYKTINIILIITLIIISAQYAWLKFF